MVPRLSHNRFLTDPFQFCAMSSRNCQRRKLNHIKGNLQPETYQTIQTHTGAILACEWKQQVSKNIRLNGVIPQNSMPIFNAIEA